MSKNPLEKLQSFGQSVWLDFLRRNMIHSGKLGALIENDGLRGITSNPAIFQKAIAESHDYDTAIRAFSLEGKNTAEIYDALTVKDVQDAADMLRPVYDRLDGADGFVSLEVNPHLARDTDGTIEEARRLWTALHRPNVFIKVPATEEGLVCIRQLISEGINVNVTLLFGLSRYREVAQAYINGLEDRLAAGHPIERVSSVASFFLSRIDVLVDSLLVKKPGKEGREKVLAEALKGEVAIACAKKAYQFYKELFQDARFRTLKEKGARPQRVLWASTSTKNPAYSDVKYVESLIGPDTVNTLPMDTLDAYRDHGNPASRLEEDLDRVDDILNQLPKVGIDLDTVTEQLVDEGIEKFNKPYDALMETLSRQKSLALAARINSQSLQLGDTAAKFREEMNRLEREDFIKRLWEKDHTLWENGGQDEAAIYNSLGWIEVPKKMMGHLRALHNFVAEIREAGFSHVVHMGMGGSSLAPLAFTRILPCPENGLSLTVLDTTDPETIAALEKKIPLDKTLFIVASKSGTTQESISFGEYFYAKIKAVKADKAGENFVVITDPQSPLLKTAEKRNYRRAFVNYADIGGRYSALSFFGLVPAALYGVDVEEILLRSMVMSHACAAYANQKENPGLTLGTVMGESAREGRDKITLLLPERLSSLGMWIEQLLAESTGKKNTGVLPVTGEPVGYPQVYGKDRLFVYFRLLEQPDLPLERSVERLANAGHPVLAITLKDAMDIGQEFIRWEIAVAVAGAILGINPFDQPNVKESKDNTAEILKAVSGKGTITAPVPVVSEGPLEIFGTSGGKDAKTVIADFLSDVRPGDYAAILAYLNEETATENILRGFCIDLRDTLGIATTLGYGPRYLHSTGQYHKGGPNTGIYIQFTANSASDPDVPGSPYGFGTLRRAQALGDFQALQRHDRRILRVDLGQDVEKGLTRFRKMLQSILQQRGEVM